MHWRGYTLVNSLIRPIFGKIIVSRETFLWVTFELSNKSVYFRSFEFHCKFSKQKGGPAGKVKMSFHLSTKEVLLGIIDDMEIISK